MVFVPAIMCVAVGRCNSVGSRRAISHVEAETSPLEDPQVDWFKNSAELDALHAIKIPTENTEIRFGGAGGGIPNTRWTRKVRTSPVSEQCHVILCHVTNIGPAGTSNQRESPTSPCCF